MPALDLPERLNAAAVFVDVHVAQGRAKKAAILCGQRAVTYQELYESVNRLGNGLRELGVRLEERVALLLPDTPEWAFAFFAAMKIGAVAVPLNTILLPMEGDAYAAAAFWELAVRTHGSFLTPSRQWP